MTTQLKLLVTAAGLLAISACRTDQSKPEQSPAKPGPAVSQPVTPEPPPPPKSDSPPDDLAAHFKGLGYMEQYEYRPAVEAFREVHRRAPGWIPGAINLAIALLNDSGVEAEKAKKAGEQTSADNFNLALELLADVLKRDPQNPYAHFCRGIILEQQGRFAEAHQHFNR